MESIKPIEKKDDFQATPPPSPAPAPTPKPTPPSSTEERALE